MYYGLGIVFTIAFVALGIYAAVAVARRQQRARDEADWSAGRPPSAKRESPETATGGGQIPFGGGPT